jgi:hypothetical protein
MQEQKQSDLESKVAMQDEPANQIFAVGQKIVKTSRVKRLLNSNQTQRAYRALF